MRNGLIVEDEGTQRWFLNDKLHRDEDDLPAVIYADGYRSWCRHGQYHRENGPAIINECGSQWWCRHGEYHRNNGPAIIYKTGHQEWFRHGKEINVKKWIKDNDITTCWESWNAVTWSLFRLEFL